MPRTAPADPRRVVEADLKSRAAGQILGSSPAGLATGGARSTPMSQFTWLPRILNRIRRRPSPIARAAPGGPADEGQAMADAEDMIARLGVHWAYLVAYDHAKVEHGGVGADLFPAGHWGRVRDTIRRVKRTR